LPDRGDREWLADVPCAPLVAGVRPGSAVLDEEPAVAATAACAEFRVALLEGARTLPTQLCQGSGSECRADEAIDQQPVAAACRLLNLMTGRPLVEKAAECDVRPCCGVVPHLLAQPVANQYRRVSGLG
jgi:hypothetical protein